METQTRKSNIQRKTKETDISLKLALDGTGDYTVATGLPFFDHMLESLTKHGLFDLEIKAIGDLEVDPHHTVEDVGICLGQAFQEALKDKKGIKRYGSATLPMDETLVSVHLDFCARPYLVYQPLIEKGRIGNGLFDIELCPEFFQAFSNSAQINLHINVHYGKNKHHIVECMFKAFAKALDQATQIDPRASDLLPSTKGKL